MRVIQLTQDNLAYRRSHEGPEVNYSVLHQLDVPVKVRGFSIKLGVKGTERYTVNRSPMPVGPGQYLLVNRHGDTHVFIDSKKLVEGFCLELTVPLVEEAMASYVDPSAAAPVLQRTFLTGEEFCERVARVDGTHLGRALQQLAPASLAEARTAGPWPYHHYLHLADALVKDHLPLIHRLHVVKTVRSGTRKDLFKRILRAQELMRSDLQKPLSCSYVAAEVCMSEFHFHRVFKACTGISPHRYMTDLRMQHARDLLQHAGSSITEVAMLVGFSDIHSFSRSFRKYTGLTPSHFRQRIGRN